MRNKNKIRKIKGGANCSQQFVDNYYLNIFIKPKNKNALIDYTETKILQLNYDIKTIYNLIIDLQDKYSDLASKNGVENIDFEYFNMTPIPKKDNLIISKIKSGDPIYIVINRLLYLISREHKFTTFYINDEIFMDPLDINFEEEKKRDNYYQDVFFPKLFDTLDNLYLQIYPNYNTINNIYRDLFKNGENSEELQDFFKESDNILLKKIYYFNILLLFILQGSGEKLLESLILNIINPVLHTNTTELIMTATAIINIWDQPNSTIKEYILLNKEYIDLLFNEDIVTNIDKNTVNIVVKPQHFFCEKKTYFALSIINSQSGQVFLAAIIIFIESYDIENNSYTTYTKFRWVINNQNLQILKTIRDSQKRNDNSFSFLDCIIPIDLTQNISTSMANSSEESDIPKFDFKLDKNNPQTMGLGVLAASGIVLGSLLFTPILGGKHMISKKRVKQRKTNKNIKIIKNKTNNSNKKINKRIKQRKTMKI